MNGADSKAILDRVPAPTPSPVAVYALTGMGAALARKIAANLPTADIFLPDRLAAGEEAGFQRVAEALAENFDRYRGHVVVAAAGIVVRALAPLIVHKTVDPAVVVVDREGRFAVSLLSGHLGGANALAQAVADITGGQAVITTATDTADLPAIEVVVRDLGLKITNYQPLSRISRLVLEGRTVPVYDLGRHLKPGLVPWPGSFLFLEHVPSFNDASPHVWVGPEKYPYPENWLVIRPPVLYVGIGCNAGTEFGELQDLLDAVFSEAGLSIASIAGLASIDLKQREPGLLALARELGVDVRFFSAEELNAVSAPNPSETVEKHVGASSVCEASAMLAAGTDRLTAAKHKSKNATLAVAQVASK